MNTPLKPNPEDLREARLTAYVLGELSPEEHNRVKSEEESDPQIKKEIDSIRAFIPLLDQELQSLASEGLDEKCVSNIIATTNTNVSNSHGSHPKSRTEWTPTKTQITAAWLALAACLVVAAISIYSNHESDPVKMEVAAVEVNINNPTSTEIMPADVAPPPTFALSEEEKAQINREVSSTKQVVVEHQINNNLIQPEMVAGSNQSFLVEVPMSNMKPDAKVIAQVTNSVRSRLLSNNSYSPISEHEWNRVLDQPLSTFSIDVDTAAYSIIRRYLTMGQKPPKDAVRIEEMINSFDYNYPEPKGEDPVSVNVEMVKSPWKESRLLLRVGLKGKSVSEAERPAANLVYLIDVSGSMGQENKLPLVKDSLKLLITKLKENDRVAIVTYAGQAGLALPSTLVKDKQTIVDAIDQLAASGSTNGGMGIHLAYDIALANYIKDGINRVMLCTDGDFNVGVTQPGELISLIEQKAKSGIFLSVYGFGMGNLKDSTIEQLADKGNGVYGYIDSMKESKKLFIRQISSTLQTIAKDVKIQIEFNPAKIESYRLIGYENRALAAKDFNNDKKDAGDMGAGHCVTALYELIPVGSEKTPGSIDALKYQPKAESVSDSKEYLTLKLRYKKPDEDTSLLKEYPVLDQGEVISFQKASADTRFAATVASFGMLLRNSPSAESLNIAKLLRWAKSAPRENIKDQQEFELLIQKWNQLNNEEAE